MLNRLTSFNKPFYFSVLSSVLLSFFLLSCGQKSDSQSVDSGADVFGGNVSLALPTAFQKPQLAGMTANVLVAGVGTFDLTVDLDGTGACGAIGVCGNTPGLSQGSHTYTIHYFLNALELAFATTTGTATAETTTALTFPPLSFPDSDGDGFSNVLEIEKGSDPLVFGNPDLSAFSISSGALDPQFDSKTTSYAANVGFLSRAITVTPTVRVAGSTVAVNGGASISGAALSVSLNEGLTPLNVIVTALDGSTRTYTINLTRQNAASFAQQAYIKASNTEADDLFGESVALSGDTLAVGARFEDSNATGIDGDETNNLASDSGAVYVFTRDSTGLWAQQAYIKASNTESNDLFGESVALSGDTLAVGARFEDSNATGVGGDQTNNLLGVNSGAVYVFTRDSSGLWTQQAYIKASNTNAGDFFGDAVALSGETLAVGAFLEDSNATGVGGDQTNNLLGVNSGAVYVFTRDSSGLWTQQAYVKASNTDANDLFGRSVALSGETLAVGARFEDSNATGIDGDEINNTAPGSGAVYVFTRDGTGQWTQQAYVKASNTDANDLFGGSVALSEDTLVVGARLEDSQATGVGGDETNNAALGSGAVYVFTRDGIGRWTQQAYVKASNTEADDLFGESVALSGDTLAVGAFLEGSNDTGIGGDETNNAASASGTVYVFTRSGGIWTQQAYVKASNTEADDLFGGSVALSGDSLAVGASFEDSITTGVGGDETNNLAVNSGTVYVFQ